MKQINKCIKQIGIIILGVLLCGITVQASDKMMVMETYTGESDISVYVKGVEEDTANDVTVQIGTTVCDSVVRSSISEKKQPMKTLIMLDNSLSIPEKTRGSIAEILQNIISDRTENEEIAIATFDENITFLSDYTSDYATLKNAVNEITYQDLETYLTDVLYDLLSTEYIQKQEDVYRRIIVISDGVDNKSIGYTKDELYTLLKENPVPVYAIGMKTGKNNEQLENMFAISRASNAESFLLDDIENLLTVNDILNTDRNIIKYKMKPASDLMDGSKKTVKIAFASGENLSVEVVMPQQEVIIQEPEEIEAEPVVEEPEPVKVQTEDNNSVKMIVIVLITVCFIVVVAAIVVVVLIIRKKKKTDFEPITDDILNQLNQVQVTDDSKTELVGLSRPSDDDSTFMIWNKEVSYDVILTDINSPIKTFHIPLKNTITIGRKQGMCSLVIDYDKSISGKHCEIRIRDGKFYIVDLQSSNGTYVNNCKVLSEVEIFSGNILKLGRVELRFEVR